MVGGNQADGITLGEPFGVVEFRGNYFVAHDRFVVIVKGEATSKQSIKNDPQRPHINLLSVL
jgi:hypothetical protein